MIRRRPQGRRSQFRRASIVLLQAMTFLPKLQPTIPLLSWCCRVKRGAAQVELNHGAGVEADEYTFSEGAWSSDFSKSDFANALFFTGSGGRTTARGVEFVTAMHTQTPIYLIKVNSEVIVSNSLAFLLTQAGDDLELRYKFYAYDLTSIMHGIRKYVPSIPTRDGNRIQLFYFCNFQIDQEGQVTRSPKAAPPAFANYQEYRRFVQTQVDAIVRNAADPGRKLRYEPITTISSGYDSPAVSVFARASGCKQAITFTTARGGGDDSGREIAAKLGLETVECEREEYRKQDGSEIEFLAVGTGGEDMVMAPLAPLLPGKLLFSGYYAGQVWSRTNPNVGRDIIKSDASGISLAEFRLRVGFLHLPAGFIGCCNHPDIYQISNSDEMKPWATLNPRYDKPIARRLVQEAGVPGHMFGQTKKAISQPFITAGSDDPRPEDILSRQCLSDFNDFANRASFFKSPFEPAYFCLMRQLNRLNRFVLRACQQTGCCRGSGLLVHAKFRKRLTKNHLIFPWAMNIIKARYRL